MQKLDRRDGSRRWRTCNTSTDYYGDRVCVWTEEDSTTEIESPETGIEPGVSTRMRPRGKPEHIEGGLADHE